MFQQKTNIVLNSSIHKVQVMDRYYCSIVNLIALINNLVFVGMKIPV